MQAIRSILVVMDPQHPEGLAQRRAAGAHLERQLLLLEPLAGQVDALQDVLGQPADDLVGKGKKLYLAHVHCSMLACARCWRRAYDGPNSRVVPNTSGSGRLFSSVSHRR